MCKRLKMLFLPTFPSIKRQRIGSNSFSNTHHIRLLLPKLTIWWGNTKMVYVPTTYQISPSSCHYYASSMYLWGKPRRSSALALKNIEVNFIFLARLFLSLRWTSKIFCTRFEKYWSKLHISRSFVSIFAVNREYCELCKNRFVS